MTGTVTPRGRVIVALTVLPILYVAAIISLRLEAGPFWSWYSIDPNIRYGLDAINLLNLDAPGNIDHPGATVQWLAAIAFQVTHWISGTGDLSTAVIGDMEPYLFATVVFFAVLTAAAMFAAGLVGHAVMGGMVPALLLQNAPFLSRILLKNSIDVKPVALFMMAGLVLMVLVVLALRDGSLERHRVRFAIAFGAVAGFAVATKITYVPIGLLPLFLLWGVRPLAIYAAASFFFLCLFGLPTLFELDRFADWIVQVAMGAGAYGGGQQTGVDLSTYPANVMKLMGRPILWLPLIISVTLTVRDWRHRVGTGTSMSPAMAALAGTSLAQFAQVLLVAKHPSAHYIVSALLLGGLQMAILAHLWLNSRPDERARRKTSMIIGVLLAGMLISEAIGFTKARKEFTQWRQTWQTVDNAKFNQCLRVYTLFSSSRTFAYLYGNHLVGDTFTKPIAATLTPNDFWFVGYRDEFRGPFGEADFGRELAKYPCFFARGSYDHGGYRVLEKHIRRVAPGLKFSKQCSTRDEAVFTSGVDCRGKLEHGKLEPDTLQPATKPQ